MTSKKRKWLIGLAIAALVAGGGGFAAMQTQQKAAAEKKKQADEKSKGPVVPEFIASEIGQISQQQVSRSVVATGSLVAARSATVRSKVNAEVREISLREGDLVRVGQSLAVLEVSEANDRIRAAQGSVAAAEARATNAKSIRDTQKGLLDKAYISQAAFDGFEASYRAAVGELDSAKANAALARQGLADAAARAPMNGVVAKRFVNPGEKVSFDSPLIHIVDLASLELQAWIDPDIAGSLRIGQPVVVTVAGFDRSVDGNVARVMPQVDPATRQLGIMVSLKPSGLPLKAGLDATAKLTFAASNQASTVVPASALQSANGEPFVWTVKGSGTEGTTTIARTRVQTLTRDDAAGVVAIAASEPQALVAGTPVLLGRYDGLKEGQTIKRVIQKALAPVAATSAVSSTAASAPASAASGK